MKILAIGDFHGKFPNKFYKIIDNENIDIVVSIGDYPPFFYRKLWFKYCYGKDVELWEFIGKKRYKKLILEDLRRAENALRKLNKVKVPVFTVLGNIDWPSGDDIIDKTERYEKSMPNYNKKNKLAKRLSKYKNIHRFDYKALEFGDYIFIGMRGHSMPGYVKSKAFRKYKKILEKLFNKFRKQNRKRKVIFVSHNVAYNTKLDKLSLKAVKTAMKGHYGRKNKKKKNIRHYGSKMARRIIEKYQPILSIGGHVHESWGRDKIGKTIVINPGEANEGKGTIIELDRGKIKKIKFIR
ncbi:MAG: metallophosphoesterase [Candidatus Pacearchaeota archaeon]|jgi:Icc-related predicted phosphoesterase